MKPATMKAKGRDTENRVVAWLRDHGVTHAERRRLAGTADQGDITGWPGVCVEIKSAAALRVPEWMAQLAAEMDHAQASTGAVIARPKGKPDVDDWWVIMSTGAWIELMTAAGWVEAQRDELSGDDAAYLDADMVAVARVSRALREWDRRSDGYGTAMRPTVNALDTDQLLRFAVAVEADNAAHRHNERTTK